MGELIKFPASAYRVTRLDAKTLGIQGRVPIAVLNNLLSKGFKLVFK